MPKFTERLFQLIIWIIVVFGIFNALWADTSVPKDPRIEIADILVPALVSFIVGLLTYRYQIRDLKLKIRQFNAQKPFDERIHDWVLKAKPPKKWQPKQNNVYIDFEEFHGKPFTPGNPVLNNLWFFGQEDLLNILREPSGMTLQSASIVGMRKSGKTSFLHRLCNDSEIISKNPGLILIYFNLDQDISTKEKFYHEMIHATADAVQTRIGAYPALTDIPPETQFKDARHFIDLLCKRNGWKLVFLLDRLECSAFSECFDNTFFNNLRSLYEEFPVAFITTSNRQIAEIGLKAYGSDCSNFFSNSKSRFLGPLLERDAREMLLKLASMSGIEFSSSEIDELLRLCGNMPYLLHIAGDIVLNLKQCSPQDDLDISIVQNRFQRSTSKYFSNLWHDLKPEEQSFLRLLAVNDPYTQSTQTPFADTFEMLGFIANHGNGYCINGSAFQKWISSAVASNGL